MAVNSNIWSDLLKHIVEHGVEYNTLSEVSGAVRCWCLTDKAVSKPKAISFRFHYALRLYD